MSRIGNQPIHLPQGVTFVLTDNTMEVTGPLGKLTQTLPSGVKVVQEDQKLTFTRQDHTPAQRALHGLARALANNMVEGVTKGFTKTLELVGTGYRVAAAGEGLTLNLGLSHPVDVAATPGVTMTVEGNNKIHIKGIDKAIVGQVAANIRKVRPPEPYKGKGIRYQDEVVRRKAGKAAKATAK